MTGPGKAPSSVENRHSEDEVSSYVESVVEEAGDLIVGAFDSSAKSKSGVETSTFASEPWADLPGSKSVTVTRKPMLLSRIFHREPRGLSEADKLRATYNPKEGSDEHSVRIDDDGETSHVTVRPSVLGGRVEKDTRTGVHKDGSRYVRWGVVRYDRNGRIKKRERKEPSIKVVGQDEDGNEVLQDGYGLPVEMKDQNGRVVKRKVRHDRLPIEEGSYGYATQGELGTHRTGDAARSNSERARFRADLSTAKAVEERVTEAVRGNGDIGMVSGEDRRGRRVSQVPREAAKFSTQEDTVEKDVANAEEDFVGAFERELEL